MELWTKICLLALCFLWYYSAISPPLCFQGADLLTESFKARHFFSVLTAAFHLMGWSGQLSLLISFFVIQAFIWGGILLIDLYFIGHIFFSGVRFTPPFSESPSFLGVPFILLIAFTPSAYWAMCLSNILFNATVSPPYTKLLINTSEIKLSNESLRETGTEKRENEGEVPNNVNIHYKNAFNFKKNLNLAENNFNERCGPNEQGSMLEKKEATFLFQKESSKAQTPFEMSVERARYATMDTVFFLPFICVLDMFIQGGNFLVYPDAPIKILGVPSLRLAGYITVPFCAFLLYRHLEATTLPTLTYFFADVKELRTLKVQMILTSFIAYGSQVYWISTLLTSAKKSLALLIPHLFPLLLASLRFIFDCLEECEQPSQNTYKLVSKNL